MHTLMAGEFLSIVDAPQKDNSLLVSEIDSLFLRLLEVSVQQLVCSSEGGDGTAQHFALLLAEHGSDGRVVVKTVAQLLIDIILSSITKLKKTDNISAVVFKKFLKNL